MKYSIKGNIHQYGINLVCELLCEEPAISAQKLGMFIVEVEKQSGAWVQSGNSILDGVFSTWAAAKNAITKHPMSVDHEYRVRELKASEFDNMP